MSRSSRRASASPPWWSRFAGVAALLLVVVGMSACGDDDPVVAVGDGPDCPQKSDFDPDAHGQERTAALEEKQPPAAWWKERHDLSLLVYGNLGGRHKPCGCSWPQVGGMERLGALYDQVARRAQGAFEAVGLGWYLADHGEEQQEYKAGFFRQAFTDLGFRALLLGTEDLVSTGMSQPFEDGTTIGKPVPPLNVPSTEGAAWHGTTPTLRFTSGGVPIVMFSLVTSAQERMGLQAMGVAPPGGWGAVATALQVLRGGAALRVVSVRLSGERAAANLEELKRALTGQGPAVIIDSSGSYGEEQLADALLGAEAPPFVLRLPDKGKAAGVLDVRREGDGGYRIGWRAIELTPKYDEAKVAQGRETVKKVLGWYQEDVKDADLLRRFPEDLTMDKRRYVGSHRCAVCHNAIYKDWLTTPHGHALQTLESIDYAHDPECIRCHVVGWHRHAGGNGLPTTWARAASGFKHPDDTPFLGGVGCENCHGPGSAHIDDPWNVSMDFGTVKRPADRLELKNKVCIACHDQDNSANFLTHYEDWYFPQIDHCEVPLSLRTVVPDHLKHKLSGGKGAPKKERDQ